MDLMSLEKLVENLTEQNSELDACNIQLAVQNKSLTRENKKLRHQCEKATQKVTEKSQLLAHFWTPKFNKWERQKEKNSNLESSLRECKQKLEAVEKRSISFQQKYKKEKGNAFYYKNKAKHSSSKIKEQYQIIQYYENMSCEQQEKANLVEKYHSNI